MSGACETMETRFLEKSVNPEVPELPGAPTPEMAAPASEELPAQPGDAPASPLAGETAQPAAAEPPRSATPGPAAPVSVPGLPGAPGMPMLPGEPGADGFDEDDSFEIPDLVEYDQIVKTEPAPGPAARDGASRLIKGEIVGIRSDGVFVHIGQKSEAFLPVDQESDVDGPLEVGQVIEVFVAGRSRDGYPLLNSPKTPKGWAQLEAAYRSGEAIMGRVTRTIKGGLSVEVGVGVGAFMPASRSGERTEEGLQNLVGQQIQARILQFDESDKNVVIDRRAILEEERSKKREEVLATLNRGDRVHGVVRTLRRFGAFVDLGGIDGLLHVSDIAWQRINDPADVLQVGQELEVEILKVDRRLKRIGVGLKQLQPEPWTLVGERFKPNDRVTGKVARIKEYGAFVEVMPGVEGLVHISDMSYSRRVRHPSEIVRTGDVVEVMVLDVKPQQRRIALGLKQALGDPWERVERDHPIGSAVTGTVRKITSFGAFVEIIDGVDALLHISDITSERRLNSPAEVLREGQQVHVKILEMDRERRRLKVGMKQLEPTELETFFSQVQVGETVSGRVVRTQGGDAVVEIGTGVRGVCPIKPKARARSRKSTQLGQTSDLTSLKAMLESAWSTGAEGTQAKDDAPMTPGSVHRFRITKLDDQEGLIQLARA